MTEDQGAAVAPAALAIIPEAGTALAVVPASAISTIIDADVTGILAAIAAKVAAHVPDVSTFKGRAAIKTLTAEIAAAKMDLVRLANKLTEGWKASTAAVVAERKVLEIRMDLLKVAARAPLTALEAIETERIAGHEAAIAEMTDSPAYRPGATAFELRARLDWLQAQPPRNWAEFLPRASATLAAEITRVEGLIPVADAREADAAELAQSRLDKIERNRVEALRAQAEHDRQIAATAAETTRLAVEAEANEKIARETQRAALAAQHATDAATKAEADRVEAASRANTLAAEVEAARLAAIEVTRAAQAAATTKAASDLASAVLAEKNRAVAAKIATDAAAQARADDVEVRRVVNNAALDAIVAAGVSRGDGVLVLTAIAQGAVPRVSISY